MSRLAVPRPKPTRMSRTVQPSTRNDLRTSGVAPFRWRHRLAQVSGARHHAVSGAAGQVDGVRRLPLLQQVGEADDLGATSVNTALKTSKYSWSGGSLDQSRRRHHRRGNRVTSIRRGVGCCRCRQLFHWQVAIQPPRLPSCVQSRVNASMQTVIAKTNALS